jgi:hypothetical protein
VVLQEKMEKKREEKREVNLIVRKKVISYSLGCDAKKRYRILSGRNQERL